MMQINIPMLRRLFLRLYSGKSVDLLSLAEKSWIICPDSKGFVPKAIYLKGALEKIEDLSPWRSWDSELASINGEQVHHMATTAHLIKDIEIVESYLYSGAAKHNPGWGIQKLLLNQSPARETLEKANLVTSKSGSHFFGPYLKDDFPLAMIPEDSTDNISMVTQPYEHAEGYRTLFNIPSSRLIRRARIRNLTLYTDFAQNEYKKQRYVELRSRVRKTLKSNPDKTSTGVYIKRGSSGEYRVLENESQIESILENAGFDIIDPSVLTAEQITRRILDTPIVVGVEGSHLSHGVYSIAANGTFIVLQPPTRFALAFKEFTDRMDMSFAFLVGEKSENGFKIQVQELQEILELIDKRRGEI